jgi:AraC-like DNA-binding protein
MLVLRQLESGPWFSSPQLIIRQIGVRETMPPCFIERPGGTDEPVGVIGQHVGLSDPYYFSKLFKSCFGVSPTRLRGRRG